MKDKTWKIYLLEPVKEQHQQSFYGKAYVEMWFLKKELISETLWSYNTKILTRYPGGKIVRHFDGWTYTTGKHIYAFCGIRKKEFFQIKLED